MTESGELAGTARKCCREAASHLPFKYTTGVKSLKKNIRPALQPVRTSPDISPAYQLMERGVLGVDLRILRP